MRRCVGPGLSVPLLALALLLSPGPGPSAVEPPPAPLEVDPALGAAVVERALACYTAEGGPGTAEDKATLEAFSAELGEAAALSLRQDECGGAACVAYVEGLECPDLARRLGGVGLLARWAEVYTLALRDRVAECFVQEEGQPLGGLQQRLELFRVGLSRALTALTDEGTCRVNPAAAAACAAELSSLPCQQLAAELSTDPRAMLQQLVAACDGLLDCGG